MQSAGCQRLLVSYPTSYIVSFPDHLVSYPYRSKEDDPLLSTNFLITNGVSALPSDTTGVSGLETRCLNSILELHSLHALNSGANPWLPVEPGSWEPTLPSGNQAPPGSWNTTTPCSSRNRCQRASIVILSKGYYSRKFIPESCKNSVESDTMYSITFIHPILQHT